MPNKKKDNAEMSLQDGATTTYVVLRRLHFHEDIIMPGKLVELSDEEAVGLLATNAIKLLTVEVSVAE